MKIQVPAFLECRVSDGETSFVRIDKILVSPELQEACLEKRKLNRVLQLIEQDPGVAKELRDWGRGD
jgi:hypothetical protein